MTQKTQCGRAANNIGLVRLYAALSVMLLHFTGYYLPHRTDDLLFTLVRKIALMFPGVVIFFFLSGFLGMLSLERTNSCMAYLKKRLLPIFPPLWLASLFTFFLWLLLSGTRNVAALLKWLLLQIFGIAYTPGSFKGIATGSLNGALWTIFVQLQFYVVLPFACKALRKLKKGWILLLASCVALNLFSALAADYGLLSDKLLKILERTIFPYLLWFVLGIFCYLYMERIHPILRKTWFLLLLLPVLITLGLIPDYGYYAGILLSVCVCFLTLAASFLTPVRKAPYDLTYEFFLYHWNFLNLLVLWGAFEALGGFVSLLLFTAGTVLVSYAANRITRCIRCS